MTEAYLLVINAATVAAFAFAFVNCLWRYSKTRKVTNFWLAVAAGIFFFALSVLDRLLLNLGIAGYFVGGYYPYCLAAGALLLLASAQLYKNNRANRKPAKHSG